MDLYNKIAVITGIAGGIGQEIAKCFDAAGAKVIGLDIKKSNDQLFEFMLLDITDFKACELAVNKIIERYGRIDILVNCAGITKDAMTEQMTEKQFDDVINVNLKGVWNITHYIGPIMRQQNEGSIINISSIVGKYGNIGQSNYAATKAGVIGLTLSWAKEFSRNGRNVRVNAIAPGYTMTKMLETVPENLLNKFSQQTMLGRLAEPREIANVALFLASDLSSYITGEVINVNGGMRL